MSLTFADLQHTNSARRSVNHETCRLILETCNYQIKHNNEYGEKCLFFVIPEIIPGRPMMPTRHVGAYLVDRLSKAGLHVRLLSENVLYVDWSQPPSHPVAKRSHKPTKETDSSAELRSRLLSFRRRAAGWTLK